MTLKPRPGIMDIAPYVGGESKAAGVNRIIRLASNENPLGPSPLAIAAYEAEKDQLHRYPDGGAADQVDRSGNKALDYLNDGDLGGEVDDD